MWIETITLTHYRNYLEVTANFSKQLNVFIGKNAQGKTNFLEAIYFLSLTRSYRTRHDKDIITFGKNYLQVSGQLKKRSGNMLLDVTLSSKGRHTKINHLKQLRLSDYIGNLVIVLFAPEDLQLIKGSPSIRRKFMDIDLGQIKPIYLSNLNQYHHILKQRNSYLKSAIKIDRTFLNVLDEQLADFGSRVVKQRFDFVKQLETAANYYHQSISEKKEKITIQYNSSIKYTDVSTLRKDFINQLSKNHQRDILKKTTTIGPHRDDLNFSINDIHTNFSSQGQQRSFVLSLKMAEVKLIKNLIGEYPVLLLDDVMSELDEHRQKNLIHMITKENIQTFITTTSLDHLHKLPNNMTLFKIDDGKLNTM